MLATLIAKSFDDPKWVFEIKWDGWRAIAEISQKKIELYSRNLLLFKHKFPEIIKSLKDLNVESAIFDGELVVLDEKGKSHFQLIQNYQEGSHKACYYIFDLLYLNGQDLRGLPLLGRKEILQNLLSHKNTNYNIRFSDHIQEKGIAFFEKASKLNLEGIIGKNGFSSYQSTRSREWVKIKTHSRQEVVIAGFTKPKGSRSKFGALLVGYYENDKLIYAGSVGGGFTEKLLADIYEELDKLVQDSCPFTTKPKGIPTATWVRPELVCEVEFSEWTNDSKLRHPVFKGMRIDKPAFVVKREIPNDQQKPKNKRTRTTIKQS